MPHHQPNDAVPDVRSLQPDDVQRMCRICLCQRPSIETPVELQSVSEQHNDLGWLATDVEMSQLLAQLTDGDLVRRRRLCLHSRINR